MTSHALFLNLKGRDMIPPACLPTTSLYLAQNPPVNLVHAVIPLTGALPDHVLSWAKQTSLLWPGRRRPLLCGPDEGQMGRESLENKVLQD